MYHHIGRMLARIPSDVEWLGVCRQRSGISDTDQPIGLDRILQAHESRKRSSILVDLAAALDSAVGGIGGRNGWMECVSPSKEALARGDRDSRPDTSRIFPSRFVGTDSVGTTGG